MCRDHIYSITNTISYIVAIIQIYVTRPCYSWMYDDYLTKYDDVCMPKPKKNRFKINRNDNARS